MSPRSVRVDPGGRHAGSAYALGVTIGAPIVAIAVANMPRKKALMSLIGVFIVGNLLCAIAPGYAVLMAARIVTAFCHGRSSVSVRWSRPVWSRRTVARRPSR
jgi:Arabinose efflux permease